jgi:hypothetical protein
VLKGALLALSLLLTAACTSAQQSTMPSSSHPVRASLPASNLHVSGALQASTPPAGGSSQCRVNQPNRGQVTVETSGMSLADGQLLRVVMTVRASPATYSAVVPILGGVTPVRVERLSAAAGGGMTGRWDAVSGTVSVDVAENVGGPATQGMASGSVSAELTLPDGSESIHVSGTWTCSFSNTT